MPPPGVQLVDRALQAVEIIFRARRRNLARAQSRFIEVDDIAPRASVLETHQYIFQVQIPMIDTAAMHRAHRARRGLPIRALRVRSVGLRRGPKIARALEASRDQPAAIYRPADGLDDRRENLH